MDELKERERWTMRLVDWSRQRVIAQDFSVQEIKANRAIKDLETNEQVHGQEIQEGLQVPQYP